MTALLVTVAWLLVVWLALLESVSPGAVVAGAVVATVLTVVFPSDGRRGTGTAFRPHRAVALFFYFSYKLLHANLHVARAVIWPAPERLRRGIVAVPVLSTAPIPRALLANCVSLTPGTFIIDIDEADGRFFVHVLDVASPDHVRRDIHAMERMIVAAFGRWEVVHELEARIAELTVSTEAVDAAARDAAARDERGER